VAHQRGRVRLPVNQLGREERGAFAGRRADGALRRVGAFVASVSDVYSALNCMVWRQVARGSGLTCLANVTGASIYAERLLAWRLACRWTTTRVHAGKVRRIRARHCKVGHHRHASRLESVLRKIKTGFSARSGGAEHWAPFV